MSSSANERAARNMELIRKTVEPLPNGVPLSYVTVRSPIAYVLKRNAYALGIDWPKVSPVDGRYLVDAELVGFVLSEIETALRRNPDLVLRENDE